MGVRAAAAFFLSVILLLGAVPSYGCSRVLGVAVDCSPTPTPKPTTKRPTGGSTETGKASAAGTLFRKAAGARASAGRPGLRYDSVAARIAREHAARMADAGKIFHNRRLAGGPTRRRLGNPGLVMENVGFGPSAAKIHKAFMNSPTHRRVIMHRQARAVGIGVVRRDGTLWVVQVFMDRNAPGGRSHAPAATSPSRRKTSRSANAPVDSPDTIVGIPAPADAAGMAPATPAGGWVLILFSATLALVATWLLVRRRAV